MSLSSPPSEGPSEDHLAAIEAALASVLEEGEGGRERRGSAQGLGEAAADALSLPSRQLVYGELDVRSVARVLDAAGVTEGDRFLDIGTGDGVPTLAAALLYPDALRLCRGIEIVPALAARAAEHARRLDAWLEGQATLRAAPIALIEGDVYDSTQTAVEEALADTTLALCFATTWSDGPRRTLPRLSTRLQAIMPAGARVIVVDARLVEGEGWRWEGDLRITPPDTAPCSTARLYTRATPR